MIKKILIEIASIFLPYILKVTDKQTANMLLCRPTHFFTHFFFQWRQPGNLKLTPFVHFAEYIPKPHHLEDESNLKLLQILSTLQHVKTKFITKYISSNHLQSWVTMNLLLKVENVFNGGLHFFCLSIFYLGVLS